MQERKPSNATTATLSQLAITTTTPCLRPVKPHSNHPCDIKRDITYLSTQPRHVLLCTWRSITSSIYYKGRLAGKQVTCTQPPIGCSGGANTCQFPFIIGYVCIRQDVYATNVLAWEIMVDRRGDLLREESFFLFFQGWCWLISTEVPHVYRPTIPEYPVVPHVWQAPLFPSTQPPPSPGLLTLTYIQHG